MITDTEKFNLLAKAKKAMEGTYSPYSNFQVGAAVLLKNGRMFKSSNVENVSYGLTICAERTLLGFLMGNNLREIVAIAVYGKIETLSPCGACRQFILECGSDIEVVFRHEGKIVTKTISELLPFAITKLT